MAGKGDGRRKGANDAAFLKNCPFPSLLERRKEREAAQGDHIAQVKYHIRRGLEKGKEDA